MRTHTHLHSLIHALTEETLSLAQAYVNEGKGKSIKSVKSDFVGGEAGETVMGLLCLYL